MLQRLQITLAQINAGNTSDNLLKSQRQGFEKLSSNDKSNLLKKVDFLVKNGL